MQAIDINLITIPPDRQRKEFKPIELADLGDSIRRVGLLHSVVLNEAHQLVAGERRLRAVKDHYDLHETLLRHDGQDVPKGMIPFVYVKDLSPLELMEAEFEENIRRENLTWQERAATVARISQVKQALALQRGEAEPSLAELAQISRGSSTEMVQQDTRVDIILAKHLDNPIVAKAKNSDEAYKALKREETKERYARVGLAAGTTYQKDKSQIFNEDCLGWMERAEAGQFDVIVTDPPYGMGADEFGDSGGKTGGEHFYEDGADLLTKLVQEVPPQLFRLAKPEAHCYLFCDIQWFNAWKQEMTSAGWRVFRTPLIWMKPSAFRAPWPQHGPQRKYECILYAVKGDRKTLRLAGDIVVYNPDENLGHPAQKPVGLYHDLLTRSALPGDRVFDPFAGSGPMIEAAHKNRNISVCIEQDAAAYGMCVQRAKGLV